jgi:hypothetical protein
VGVGVRRVGAGTETICNLEFDFKNDVIKIM